MAITGQLAKVCSPLVPGTELRWTGCTGNALPTEPSQQFSAVFKELLSVVGLCSFEMGLYVVLAVRWLIG